MKQSSSTAWPASGPDCKPAETLTSVLRLSLRIDEIRDRLEKKRDEKSIRDR